MIVSFGWTTDEFLAGKKTVTRRLWTEKYFQAWVRAWNNERLIHQAYNKQACYGGKQIGRLELTCCPYREPIIQMPEADCEAEGGKCQSVEEFIEHYFKGDRTLTPVVLRFLPILEVKG
jgi:hypothetical protein